MLVAAALILAGCGAGGSAAGVNDETVTVQRGTLRVSASGSGRIEAAQTADLAFAATGTVERVLVVEGQQVEQGQELASLDRRALEADVAGAQAQIDQSRAQLEKLRAGEKPSQYDIRIAEANVRQIEAQLESARGVTETLEAQLEQAELQLEKLRAGKPPSEFDLAASEAAVRQAEARLATARLNLEKAILRAPFAGLVAAVNLVPGTSSPPGQAGAAITLIDMSRLHVLVSISEVNIAQLQEGQTAEVLVDALGSEPIQGTVRYIAPVATVTQDVATYSARVELPAGQPGLLPGMTVSVDVAVDEKPNVLLVPNSAISSGGGRRIVRLRQGETFVEREIQTGLSNDVDTEVTAGLNEGDVIAAIGVVATDQGFGD